MRVLVTAEAHNEAMVAVPDRRPAWEAWMRENRIPSKDNEKVVYDTDAWTLTAYRFARWPVAGPHEGARFYGYRGPDGEWVMDRTAGEAREEPETYRYFTDPADWMLDCGEALP